MSPETLRLPAHAKINLSLEVTGKRDDGYHEIAAILQTVDLADMVTLRMARGLSVECDHPSLSGPDNIAWPAAVALANYADIAPNAHITIEKRIPVAAGLGGGSADAAAALRGLNRLWSLNLPDAELASVAAGLGSDVPFLLRGGLALAEGRGDILSPLPSLPHIPILLVAPAETIPAKTPTLYRSLSAADFTDGAATRQLALNLAQGNPTSGNFTSQDCRNAFECPAKAVFPSLARLWERTAMLTAYPPRLSGAGPTIFCIPSNEGERNSVAHALQDTGATAYFVRAINPTSVV